MVSKDGSKKFVNEIQFDTRIANGKVNKARKDN